MKRTKKCKLKTAYLCLWSLIALTLAADAVRLIRENGIKANTFYYHLGDGRYAYQVNSETHSSIYFKCVAFGKGCRGRAILRIGGRFLETAPHNHPPDPDFVGERHFREHVLNRVVNARYVDFQNIVDEFRRDQRFSRNVRAKMTLNRLAPTLRNARRRRYPAGIRSLRDLTRELLRNNGLASSVDGQDNLYAGSVDATDGSHHILFLSRRSLDFMSNLKLLQGDGTFRSRPSVPPSSQLFAIVTTWRNVIVPLGWVLMERKTLSAYRSIFHLLKTLCPRLNPDLIITDWEHPQQMAWQEAFPNAQVQGCLWHLCRAFLKKANNLRILRFKTLIPYLLDFIRKACAICLLPPPYFRNALELLRTQARETSLVLAFVLIPFFRYVETRWIDNDRRQERMTLYNSQLRTNNACESHNRMLRNEVGAHRPNVFMFIEALSRMEHNAHLDIHAMNHGLPVRAARRWKSVYRDVQLSNLANDLEMDVFQDEDETITNFLSRASHLFDGAFEYHLLGLNDDCEG